MAPLAGERERGRAGHRASSPSATSCRTPRLSIKRDRRRSLAEWRGTPVLITFIYTRCPLPTFCPLMDQNFATIQRRSPKIRCCVAASSLSRSPSTPITTRRRCSRRTRRRLQGRPGRLDVPHRRSRDHRSVRGTVWRRPVAQSGVADRHHPQSPHGSRRRRRPRRQDLHRQRVDDRDGAHRPARTSCSCREAPRAGPGPARSREPSAALIRRLRTPRDGAALSERLPYNTEPPPDPATLRSFRGVVAPPDRQLHRSGDHDVRDARAARLSART